MTTTITQLAQLMTYRLTWLDGQEPSRCDNLTNVVCEVSRRYPWFVSERQGTTIRYWATLGAHSAGNAPFAVAERTDQP